MKVALIGNMNNSFFSLVRFLRDKGIDASLLLHDDEYSQFNPAGDSFDLNYEGYIRRLPWGNPFNFLKANNNEIADSIKEFDLLIGCHTTPAFLQKIGRVLDIFMPYGTDIYEFPFFNIINDTKRIFYPNKIFNYYFFSKSQRTGIQKARTLWIDLVNDDFEKVISKLAFPGNKVRMPIPFLYTPTYNPGAITRYYKDSQWYREFQRIREANDLVVFHHSRHVWKNIGNPFRNKGNDKLVKGFSEFVKKNNAINACLVLFEYGDDVNETKNLCKQLNIEKHVKWFPIMMRKEIMVGVSLADVVAGEFGMSWLSYGIIYEALSMGKPVMHHREDKLYQHRYPQLYPMIHANSAKQVCKALNDVIARPEFYKEMGENGRKWFQKYAVDRPLNECLKLIQG